ncbi:universal stress protein [Pseudomonas saliphila]|uniref:universal stress protein n=1 Tax=Pseudomonas saliphila TaxID=2586906 RepID=UPI00123B2DE1|nr:universal stress protein [Pseudomonas saliphila]
MSHNIKRILCSIGMRGNCDHVVEQSIRLAFATGASLVILHVVKSLANDVLNTLRSNIRDRDVLGSLMEQRIAQGRTELVAEMEAFWGRHPQLKELMKDRVIELSVLEGYPASVISHFASRGEFDLIVMAANKKTYMATYAGKVTKGVIARAKVPVVVVPAARTRPWSE